jgi:predicted anti-sigma-YlaC factor YlaD
MMHVLPCDRVRDDLPAYHDGELSIDQQVLIQSHLQECIACRLEAAELAELGNALRTMAAAVPGRNVVETGELTGSVLERIRVEEQFSLAAQIRGWFDDMHLVWAGLGATTAMLFCVFASAGVLQAASQERSDSLAGIISTVANGSSGNSIRLADRMLETRALLDTTAAMPGGEDAEVTMSALVTRDGRIQNLEVVAEQARTYQVKPEVLLAMLEAASRARFVPAQAGGEAVAVNVVWLVTSTTVKGHPDYELYLLSPPGTSEVVTGPVPAPKPRRATATPAAKPSSVGNEGLAAA